MPAARKIEGGKGENSGRFGNPLGVGGAFRGIGGAELQRGEGGFEAVSRHQPWLGCQQLIKRQHTNDRPTVYHCTLHPSGRADKAETIYGSRSARTCPRAGVRRQTWGAVLGPAKRLIFL
jgi:hypothetical protein